MLCQNCQNVKFEPLTAFQDQFAPSELPNVSANKATSRGPFYFPHQPSIQDLRSSGNSGCHLCAQIWYSYGGLESYVPISDRFWLYYLLVGDENIPRAIQVSCGGPQSYGYAFLDSHSLKNLVLQLYLSTIMERLQ
jgi:hypothetical protein